MQPKKNAKADLEGKRSLFFLIGTALSLIAFILIIQYESQVEKPQASGTPITVDIGEPAIVTVWKEEKKEQKKIEKSKNIDKTLPPEVKPKEPQLRIFDPGIKEAADTGIVKVEAPDELDKVETLDWVFIENIARPVECEKVTDQQEQKECFNKWIHKYILQNTIYPRQAKDVGLQDKVYVEFVISEEGKVTEVSIAQGQYEILNREALRVMQALPEMTPASQQGKTVRMRMTVPVNFKLSGR